MSELVIEVERRERFGKGANRKLRAQGLIPAVVYGGGKEPVPVVVDRKAVTELLHQEKGKNTLFLLRMKGTKQERHAMLKDFQVDPITQQYLHLDFIRVIKGQQVKVEVPVELVGESVGVKAGGFLDFTGRSLHLECPADAIPDKITVDISRLHVGQHIAAGDLKLPSGVKLLDDPHKILVTIEGRAVAVEEEVPVAATEEMAEPEVIRRGKVEEEGEQES
ncbi:MAG: 50S ribosomal protein L25/general stress protein Ctc [Thermoanaerobaculum sp.]|nr:50S ribosomal protein L25/general stress protein Ctc [Thermoanaerobaculum sp.]MDW7968667.1 50S ribosomal protein L25/general stress protein Ctc [Thermoanaerobaculum sp.]